MIDSAGFDAIEHAAFDAWPALEESVLSGWRLRVAGGYTKRANSANADASSGVLGPDEIGAIERFYADRRLGPIFRIPSYCAAAATDPVLARRGYRFVDPSLVMAVDLAGSAASADARDDVAIEASSDPGPWLNRFQRVSGKVGPDQQVHLEMLRAIRGRCTFLVAHEAGEPAACGLGVLTGDLFGLFDIVSSPARRRRGLARQLCTALLEQGRLQGARIAYLQVAESNSAALPLYEQLGFVRAYRYWYRVRG